MREKNLTPDLSISGNFEQLWFWWQKSPPTPQMRGKRGKFFDTRSIHFRQFWVNLVLVAEKLPPPPLPRWGKNFLIPDISISGNFKQLWFWWQKSPPLPIRENFLTPDLSISANFEQLWFWWQKSPPPPMKEKLLTPDLSTSGNFEQLWFWWKKRPPPPDEGKNFDTRSIHFRQFQATLVLVEEKPPPKWGKIFLHWIYPFQTILSNFGFCGRKAPLSFVPFHERHNSCYPCGIPMVPILQICTQIPPIWISSLGY